MWELILTEMDVPDYLYHDTHCIEAVPLPAINWRTSQISISDGVAWKEYKLDAMSYDGKLLIPDCKKISSLIYSMSTFEHLKVTIQAQYQFY